MSISKLKQQAARNENDADLLQPTEIVLRRSSSVAHLHARLGSRLKNLGQQSRSPSLCLIFTCRLLSPDSDRRHNSQRTERRQKVSDEKSKKSVRSALQNTVGRVSRSRDLFLFGLSEKFLYNTGFPLWFYSLTRVSGLFWAKSIISFFFKFIHWFKICLTKIVQ